MPPDQVRIRLLRRFAVQRGETETDRLRTRKTEGLLAWLALNRETAFTRPALIDRFWPEEDEAAARRKLRLALHSIRQEIGDALETERDQVRLTNVWVDALDDPTAGELLPDFDFDWLPAARADVAARYEAGLQAKLETQDEEGARETLYALIESDPYEPHWYRRLHRILTGLGRKGEAKTVAHIARTRLGADCPPALRGSTPTPAGPRRSFVGRNRIFAHLSEILLGDREPVAATLVGPGGIGKTRLGQELIAHAKREGIDTVFARLLDRATKEQVQAAVYAALGANPETFDVTAFPPTLLVLDNCEQCALEAERWLAELLQAGSSLRILATSQRPLEGFPGEDVAVPALSPPEASLLFAIEAELDLDAETAPKIATVVRRMGGVPLAIRHAAARLAEMSLDELVASLETFDRGRDRDPDPRHRSVANCVQWSLSLLDPRLREQLTKLAFFADGFRPDSAAALGVDTEDLGRLTRLTWVTKRHGEEGLELLPPFRAVLRGLLPETESAKLNEALTLFITERVLQDVRDRYASLVELLSVHLRDIERAFDLEMQKGDLKRAETLLVGLYHVKQRNADLEGIGRDMARFFAAVPAEEKAKYPNAWNLYGSIAYFQGDFDLAESRYAVAARGDDPYLRSVGHANLALVAMRRRDFATATPLLESALEYPDLPMRSRSARWLNLSECLLASGRSEEAETIALRELASLTDAPEVRTIRGLLILLLGEIALVRDDLVAAKDWTERAIALFLKENHRARLPEARALSVCLVDREHLKEEFALLLECDEAVRCTLVGFGLALHLHGEGDLAAPFLAAIDWDDDPVWVKLRFGHLQTVIDPREGLRHSSRDEWRLRAENAMKRL